MTYYIGKTGRLPYHYYATTATTAAATAAAAGKVTRFLAAPPTPFSCACGRWRYPRTSDTPRTVKKRAKKVVAGLENAKATTYISCKNILLYMNAFITERLY